MKRFPLGEDLAHLQRPRARRRGVGRGVGSQRGPPRGPTDGERVFRLRALATALNERELVDPGVVAGHVRAIAEAETGTYLRENLGESLAEIIDLEALEQDLVEDLRTDEG